MHIKWSEFSLDWILIKQISTSSDLLAHTGEDFALLSSIQTPAKISNVRPLGRKYKIKMFHIWYTKSHFFTFRSINCQCEGLNPNFTIPQDLFLGLECKISVQNHCLQFSYALV